MSVAVPELISLEASMALVCYREVSAVGGGVADNVTLLQQSQDISLLVSNFVGSTGGEFNLQVQQRVGCSSVELHASPW